MLSLVKKILHMAGDLASKIKISFLFSFFDGIFLSFPLVALFYLFTAVYDSMQQGAQITGTEVLACTLILLAGLVGRFIFKYLIYRYQGVSGYWMAAKERIKISERLKRLPMGFFKRVNQGEIITIAGNDVQYIEQYAPYLLDQLVNSVINVVVLSVCMFFFSWQVGVVFCLGLICAILIINVMSKRSRVLAPAQKAAQTEANSATLEYLHGLSVYKLFNIKESKTNRTSAAYRQYAQQSYGMEKTFVPLNACFQGILKIACGVILFLAPWLVLSGGMGMVHMTVILIASFNIFNSIEALGGITGMIRIIEASISRVESITEEPLIDENGKDIPLNAFDISFQNVSFSYEGDESAIDNVSFTIPEKKMTAIVGPSGCGKTTIIRLIARFWDIQKGKIEIGGVDIKEMLCDSLLKNISMVFQNVYLFEDTILNNIRIGRPGATREEVEEAAKKACCHEFIAALPEGYDTKVGEGGNTLSGGEKQRISIARAILKDAPIILLDEATSSIDPENEAEIQRAIGELVKNKTLVMIAHKLSTVQDADQILVMENGRLTAQGNHESLLESSERYRSFCEIRKRAEQWEIA